MHRKISYIFLPLTLILILVLIYYRSNKLTLIQMPLYVKNREYSVTPQKIPRLLYQTNERMEVPLRMYENTLQWLRLNPEYTYQYFTDEQRRDFIYRNFDHSVGKAYDSLIPGAFKADLWR